MAARISLRREAIGQMIAHAPIATTLVPLRYVRVTRRLSCAPACYRGTSGASRGGGVVARGVHSFRRDLATNDSIPVAARSADGAGNPGQHRGIDHDRRVNRLRYPADDPYAGVHTVLTTHPSQLCPRSHH